LLKASIAPIQLSTEKPGTLPPVQTMLQLAKSAAISATPEQSPLNPLTAQFKTMPVS
jgi:hypothetical protein